MDTLLSMRIFVRIVETGSLTRASDSTGLTTPRVSTLLRALEQHLGCKLLNRTTRRLSLTEDGNTYYQHCVTVLGEIDDMEASLSRARKTAKGRLRVNMPSAMAKHIVIPALPSFVDAYPEILFELSVTDSQIDVIGEGVDCVVRVGTLDDSGLIATRIGSVTTCTCAAPSYLARHGTPECVDDLTAHQVVNYLSSDTGRPRSWNYVVGGNLRTMPMRGPVAVNDADAYVACALAGLGLVQTSMYLLEPHLRSQQLREVLHEYNSPPRPVSVLYAPNRQLPHKLRLFIDWVTSLFARNPVLQGRRPDGLQPAPQPTGPDYPELAVLSGEFS
ncbi:LysR family transcriptional regulator [Paraburkholderia caballeronis]|uniref:Transcriptional regulator, LysR family n=1 Tax=Paraburkholderia caballeronis TaxID=416943 RepID=A0A1H7L5S2_9BURK|nr:LysR family transcriptional regulator [Paraburkholderia caballeronis]PXW28307.1 LysR family transcriptional regulator [Paraburkholderia caballeronis]PXX03673.1 LysR family transcriptional regulator [Paraburkholderia caballeronis]RAK04417.1 LysR family transcriptional regulator [Paraburkholderia caballeronis]SED81019.1 transcriptional regulator, LysR family [Paraburkholderia caballeronis]SEK94351.1 transcriptional regulator, LysR family [Paraburkholderia caballeronis]